MNTGNHFKKPGIAALLLSLVLINPLFGQEGASPVYKDKKNGYFIFSPPKGWTPQEYSDPRSKVAFNHPADTGVLMRLIVREAPAETFADMIKADEQRSEQFNAKGVSCKVEQSECLGVPCSKIYAEIPGTGFTLLTKFIISGLHFNIQFASPEKEKFDRYLDEVMQSINSIVVLAPSKPDSEKARRQQIANIVRLSELANISGYNENACLILEDGLKEFPDEAEIKNKMEIFKCGK